MTSRVVVRTAILITFLAVFLAVLGGCSMTAESLQSNPDAESQTFPDSYEEISRRLTSMADRCYRQHITPGSSIDFEGEMHRDRGVADFRLVAGSLGVASNYFISARIEKIASGSRVTTKTNNSLISGRLSKIIFRWAGGDQDC
jgi:hypothetical protein